VSSVHCSLWCVCVRVPTGLNLESKNKQKGGGGGALLSCGTLIMRVERRLVGLVPPVGMGSAAGTRFRVGCACCSQLAVLWLVHF
jgi:hypothetical protein